jgi:phospholipid transport system transporter-binding protein
MNSSSLIVSIDGQTLKLSGVLDEHSVLSVDAQGKQWLIEQSPHDCEIDLSKITYSNSVGIALLLGWLRVAQAQGKQLCFSNPPQNLVAMAQLGGLETLFL